MYRHTKSTFKSNVYIVGYSLKRNQKVKITENKAKKCLEWTLKCSKENKMNDQKASQ